jgi:hypothetical protein
VTSTLRALGLALIVGVVALPGSAAASVRFGQDLTASANATPACPGMATECSAVQTDHADGEPRAGSPIDGVVTMWRTRAAVNGNITFQVVRRSGATSFRVVGSDTQAAQQNIENQFFVRIPIKEGDLLGLDAPGANEPYRSIADPDPRVARFAPPLGSVGVAPTAELASTELLVNAVVEPDADGDEFGDDSQDQCPTNAATQGACTGTLVGPDLSNELQWGAIVSFGSSLTFLNGDAPSPDGSRIPSDGVIVRWRIRSTLGTWAPQLLRPEGGGVYRSIATGEKVTVAAPHDQPGFPPYIRSFPTRIQAKAGDVLGVRVDGSSRTVGRNAPAAFFNPPLADGESRDPDFVFSVIIPVNGDLEPDADGDGFGDITQDGCPASAATQGACPPEPIVTPPDPLDPFGVAALAGGSLRYAGGRVLRIPAACPATAERCRGLLEARANLRLRKAGASRIVRLGRVRFLIPGGETRNLRLRLSKPVRLALRRVRRVRVTIVITPSGPGAVRRAVTLVRPAR